LSMEEQIQLPIAKAEGKGPRVSPEEVAALQKLLASAGCWLTAARISALAAPDFRWCDRRVRAIANASEGRIISGQPGYKLARLATLKEIQHAIDWLRHQAKEMQARALQIDRVYHGKLRTDATE
jgi:hypothetical protein